MLIFLWKFIVFHFLIISCCLLTYVNPEDNPGIPAIAKYFNTKGRYEEVNPYLREDILAVNRSILQPPSAQCQEIHLTVIIRHGTRYPTTKNIKGMQQLYNIVLHNASGEESWLREIQTQWRMWYTEDMDGRLVQKDMEFDYAVNDALMRFFDQCTRFVQEVDNNPSALSEVDKFKQGPEMRRVQEKIADRLRVPYSLITHDMTQAAFYLCAYEFAIKAANSPWCQLFDEEGAKVMEYASDLREFWKRGYGYDINSKSSCALFHDVFSRLDKAASEINSGQQVTEAVTVQVGHADTLLPLLTLLGFFKDNVTLTSTNYATQAKRSFRTSHMLPYAANLLLVLYDCGGGDLRLQPLLNEKPVTFPGLTDQRASIPLYQDVRGHYSDLLKGCDFETECQLFKHPAEV
ncbi:multiple inositol polyphosphate phosphatase 1-like isoform X2 [Micropterus dolomieu]|uniref:multiple inositol polyphosphate phosphatase 1-like isoform X2 n=1 Tax=Micropterus dolomieu TaxID=147949 RepID=UPI001E8DB1DD|nr:multiple inositol polyphosphate phosphatase 1-like isoform X2 [Micropterus dolomieu]